MLFLIELLGSLSWWRVCEAVVHMNGDACILSKAHAWRSCAYGYGCLSYACLVDRMRRNICV